MGGQGIWWLEQGQGRGHGVRQQPRTCLLGGNVMEVHCRDLLVVTSQQGRNLVVPWGIWWAEGEEPGQKYPPPTWEV